MERKTNKTFILTIKPLINLHSGQMGLCLFLPFWSGLGGVGQCLRGGAPSPCSHHVSTAAFLVGGSPFYHQKLVIRGLGGVGGQREVVQLEHLNNCLSPRLRGSQNRGS